MAGNKQGGINARDTNYKRYGRDFYVRIGELGGKKSKGGAFMHDHELARRAGRIGGKVSRRSWTDEDRERHGETMRAVNLRRRYG